jgi:hypothetical protein
MEMAAEQAVGMSPRAAAEGWIELFDGQSLLGWSVEGGGVWGVLDGQLTSGGAWGWLRSNVPFADFRMRVEMRANTAGARGAFLLRAGSMGDPRRSGMAVEFGEGKSFELKSGAWHVCDIYARGSDYVVKVDGREVFRRREFRQENGYFGLMVSAGQVAVRNVQLRPLEMACLFNGKNLAGWRRVESGPARVARWSVENGMIHVEQGPGRLETEYAFDDFVLQADVRANGGGGQRRPSGGIFLRGDRDFFWSGYEAEIRNEYQSVDPDRTVGFGRNGIYRNQVVSRVVAGNEWFTKTIVASGRRLAVWVNGVAVMNREDPNPEGRDVRSQRARLVRGTISLQADDGAASLDFRNILIAPLARIGER